MNPFLDPHTAPSVCPKSNVLVRALRTLRYKAASTGLPITENERRLKALRDQHRGERCFIIGNGPSLNELDLTLLKDECTFGVNAIYTNKEKMGFFPTYYVVEDVFVAEDRKEEINSFHGSTKFFGNYFHYCLDSDDSTIWLNVIFDYRNYSNFPNFSTDALRRVWVGGTVSYICMQLAYYMGFSEVILVGFDHSYKIPNDAIVEGNDILSTGDDPNHFDSNYFGEGKRWHDPRVDRMELAYRKAREFFELDGRKIMNATAGGKLEVFDRVDYAECFHK